MLLQQVSLKGLTLLDVRFVCADTRVSNQSEFPLWSGKILSTIKTEDTEVIKKMNPQTDRNKFSAESSKEQESALSTI